MNTDRSLAFTFTTDGTQFTDTPTAWEGGIPAHDVTVESVGFQLFPEPITLIGGIPMEARTNDDGTISVWQDGKCLGTTVKP